MTDERNELIARLSEAKKRAAILRVEPHISTRDLKAVLAMLERDGARIAELEAEVAARKGDPSTRLHMKQEGLA